MRRFMFITTSLAVVLGLGGCVTSAYTDAAIDARRVLVGIPKTALLGCAGVPARQAGADGREYYTYVASSYREDQNGYYVWSGGGWGRPYHWQYVGPTAYRSEMCEATFTLVNGKVDRLVYAQNSDYNLCYGIIANCMPPAPIITNAPASPAPTSPAAPAPGGTAVPPPRPQVTPLTP